MREDLQRSAPGANLNGDGSCSFRIWAPKARGLSLELLSRRAGDPPRRISLERDGEELHALVEDVRDGDRYFYVFPDGRRRPDPRSRRQPEGVHGPSAVVDLSRFNRPGGAQPPLRPFADWVIYELHVGTFTPAGTFDGVIGQLGYLRDELGVSAIELMPVSPFPGDRGWGYDGVLPFAVQEAYGGPAGLSRLVRAAHDHGLAVILDVVYNHLGPEGNYLRDFGPYFTKKHETPWGEALNFDDAGAAAVRRYFLDNAEQWIRDYGIDALRLDAIQMIRDDSPTHLLAEVARVVHDAGGLVIAESDRNDPITVRPRGEGGWGHDAQWSDDLHHALHASLTGERQGYYIDYGQASDVAAALTRGFVYDGSRPSRFRGSRYGESTAGVPIERHVVCLQNHDQIGNRAVGDRIAALAGPEAAKAGAAAILLAPAIPLLFMGEEYGAKQPFLYFTSHSDPALAKAVSAGRRNEFAAFAWKGEVPDPQAEETFARSVLHLEERQTQGHEGIFAFYRALIALRSAHPALQGIARRERTKLSALEDDEVVTMERWSPDGSARLLLILSLGRAERRLRLPLPPGRWRRLLVSSDPRFGGEGPAAPAALQAGDEIDLAPRSAWVFEG